MSSLAPAPCPDNALRQQFAALCWRMHGDRPEVLLITSRDTGRWIVPKGWPMENRSPAEAAAREAWEEAGVEGRVAEDAFGSYSYAKVMPRAPALPCRVQVFPLRVDRLVADYPERRQRRRKWFSAQKAARKVDEPDLRALILHFAAAGAADAAAPAGTTDFAAQGAGVTDFAAQGAGVTDFAPQGAAGGLTPGQE